jgi:rhodanese-related sulfurtransferase
MFNLFPKIPSVTPEEASRSTEKSAVIIDVRSPEEFERGHASGARNIPLQELERAAENISQGEEVYLICQTGGRSGRATQFLIDKGVNAKNIVGGTNAWSRAGLPME